MPERSQALLLSGIALVVASADQGSKVAIGAAIGPRAPTSSIDVVGPWLTLEYAENRGVAFGLLAGIGPVLSWVIMLIVVGLLVHFAQTKQPARWEVVGIGLVAGGAIGNLIDRLRLGYVVDFIAVGRWPNFNVADSAITIGVTLLLWGHLAAGRHATSAVAG